MVTGVQTCALPILERIRSILAALDKPVFVTQHGRVKAVLMGIDTYNSLVDELDDARLANDPEIRRAMADMKGAYERGEMIPLEDALRNAV